MNREDLESTWLELIDILERKAKTADEARMHAFAAGLQDAALTARMFLVHLLRLSRSGSSADQTGDAKSSSPSPNSTESSSGSCVPPPPMDETGKEVDLDALIPDANELLIRRAKSLGRDEVIDRVIRFREGADTE